MDADSVLDAVRSIIWRNKDKVYLIAQTSGGWEGWLQCEVAWYFKAKTIREVDVWDDGRKCDFYFESTKYIAELKALGWNVIQTSKRKGGSFQATQSALNSFVDRVVEDKRKVEGYKGQGISIAVVPTFILRESDTIINKLRAKGYRVEVIVSGIRMAFWRLKASKERRSNSTTSQPKRITTDKDTEC